MKTVSIIGCGQIGGALVQGLDGSDSWQLGRVFTRHARPALAAHTSNLDTFLAHPADLIIDTAGPDALRTMGAQTLGKAPLWSVGAVAMADPAFRTRIASASRQSGNVLRLFACGMANMPLKARQLRITMHGPEITEDWSGPLPEAVPLWPNRLNTAVAAALNGPGLEATHLTMKPGTAHQIDLQAEGNGISWQRSIRFDLRPDVPHPVAQMLLRELALWDRPWQGV